MPCYHPLQAWRSRFRNASGKRALVFNSAQGFIDKPVTIPCGKCIGCKLERSRQWAIRCVHESKLHENNCFVTLTYNNENLPKDGSLHLEHLQKFFKKLRKKYGEGIRYFACGEYGDKNSRPHYHICLFNHEFPDKEAWEQTRDYTTYRSKELEKLWTKGFSLIGALNFESAAYTARYVTKKITGENAEYYYRRVDETTGKIKNRIKPEFVVMSRGGRKKGSGGIGSEYYEKYKKDFYTIDSIILRGKKIKPPKFYDKKFEIENPEEWNEIKNNRKKLAIKLEPDNTYDRRLIKEKFQNEKHKLLKRSYENVNY